MKHATLLLPILVLVLSACEEDRVSVHIRPKPDGTFVRTVKMWRVDTAKPGVVMAPSEPLLTDAKGQYGKAEHGEDGSVLFRGTFREVPPDLSVTHRDEKLVNRGGYSIWRCRAGSFAAYRERRPGPTDYWGRIRRVSEGIDLAARLLAQIARIALEGEPGLDRLLQFIGTRFPEDLKDVALRAGAMKGGSGAFAGDHGAAFLLQLLEERGYVRIASLPSLADEAALIREFCRFVAKKMGRPDDERLRDKIATLVDEKRSEELANRALSDLELTKEEVEERMEPLGTLFFGLDFDADPKLTYSLALPESADLVESRAPLDEDTRTVTWGTRLDDSHVRDMFYATWATPDSAWQKQRLGAVVLRGKKLRDYVMWLEGLPAEQAKAWETAVDALEPGPGFEESLADIRVTPPRSKEDEFAPERGAELLIEALGQAGK